MLTVLMIMLATAPTPPPLNITWSPAGVTLEKDVYQDFERDVAEMPDEKKPTTDQEKTCLFTRYLMMRIHSYFGPKKELAKNIADQAAKYSQDNCYGGGTSGKPLAIEGRRRLGRGVDFFMGKYAPWFLPKDDPRYKPFPGIPSPQEGQRVASSAPPFALPPMPDRAGQDLGVQFWTMFQALEVRLAKGGHVLKGDGRACAWASAALAGAEAVQRTPAATSGIGAAVPVLDGQRVSTCRGDALAQKEAAWNWLRANPGATVPLEVARKAPVPAFPSSPGDPMLWVGAGLLFSVAPEAAPVLLLAR